jgi:hypothetical protein
LVVGAAGAAGVVVVGAVVVGVVRAVVGVVVAFGAGVLDVVGVVVEAVDGDAAGIGAAAGDWPAKSSVPLTKPEPRVSARVPARRPRLRRCQR